MRRRLTAFFLCAALLLCAVPLSPAARAYSDTAGSWAEPVIEQARDYGLITGYPDGTFGVGRSISRGEFVTILCRMFSWEKAAPAAASYSDCPHTYWCWSEVETALAHGVMDAASAFRPADPITREEMAVMLVRALGYGTLAQAITKPSYPFDDVTANQGYVDVAYHIGMTTGVERNGQLKFLPGASATREEAAAMLVRVYERYISKTDWLHGFYAISSYSQIQFTDRMDAVSLGWARLEYGPDGLYLNSTAANGNEWVKPDGAELATGYFDSHALPYNLNVFASAGDSVTLADGSASSTVAAAVSTAEGRARTVAILVDAAADYSGLTLDFESLKGGTLKANYAAFMAQLRAALPADKTLYVCVQPDTWYDGYDYRALGEVCDKVILMAHDYQWTSVPDYYVGGTNTDSPVTPFSRIYEALCAVTDPETGVADRSKLALAISFGTAGFQVDEGGTLLSATIYHPPLSTLAKRLSQPDTVVTYSEIYRNPAVVYTTEDGGRYRVWYENEQSVTDKLALARMFGITGVSLWRLGNIPGYEGYDVWSAVCATR